MDENIGLVRKTSHQKKKSVDVFSDSQKLLKLSLKSVYWVSIKVKGIKHRKGKNKNIYKI